MRLFWRLLVWWPARLGWLLTFAARAFGLLLGAWAFGTLLGVSFTTALWAAGIGLVVVYAAGWWADAVERRRDRRSRHRAGVA